MEKFNVLIQAYQHLKIHREMWCCITIKFLTLDLSATMKMQKLCEINEIVAK